MLGSATGNELATALETPCIGICQIDEASRFCVGCGRSVNEIASWAGWSAEERRDVMRLLPERLERLPPQYRPVRPILEVPSD